MKKIIDSQFPYLNIIRYTEFDSKNPFDVAYSICNWLDGQNPRDIDKVVDQLRDSNLLNSFGQEVCVALGLFCGYRATNKGLSKGTLKLYKRYDEWRKKNKINDPIKDLGWRER